MTLVEHFESYLGPIVEGWHDANDSGVQVVRFADQPTRDVSTYTTLGLSQHVLPMHGNHLVRQELLVCAYNRYPRKRVASFLATFAEYVASQHRALLRGDIVGPSAPLIPEVMADAVYSAMPVLFDEELATFRGTSPPVVVVWLLPLVPPEAPWVKRHGWNMFEDLLEQTEVDFFSLDRAPVCSTP